MTNNQNRVLSLTLAVTAAAAVIWATWPTRPLQGPLAPNASPTAPTAGGLTALGDGAARARALAALGASTQSTPLVQPPALTDSSATTTPAGVANTAGNIDPSTNQPRIVHPTPNVDEVTEMTIKQLGNFAYDAERGGDVPGDVGALDGTRVRLRGFMWPLGQATLLTDFVLVPSLTSCCFGQPPGVQHIITTRLPAKKAVPFVTDEVWVEGTLHVKVIREEGYTSSIFEMDATIVKLVGP